MKAKAKHAESARNFQFQGIGFGDDPDDMEFHFETWMYEEAASNPKAGIEVYAVTAPGVDIAMLFFFDRKLFLVKLVYSPDRLNSMGDWTAITDRLVSQFGKANSGSLGGSDEDCDNETDEVVHFSWLFDDVYRSIDFKVLPNYAVIEFRDTNLSLAAYNQKKRKADIGF